MRIARIVVPCIAAALLSTGVQAASLSFVDVAAPDVNCVFDPSCKITVTDSVATIVLPAPVWTGNAHLQSRTFAGVAGAPGAGKTGYLYRVDLTQAVSDGEVPCVTDIAVDFGPVTKLQYNKAGPLDDVFVITKGGLGSVGLFAVEQTGTVVSFVFNQPVCAGTKPGSGMTSFFFGLASDRPPRAISANVSVPGLEPIEVPARAPGYGRSQRAQ